MKNRFFWVIVFASLFFVTTNLYAQTYSSISNDDKVYLILSDAKLRGLCKSLPSVRPYTYKQVQQALLELLETNQLSDSEKEIVQNTYNRLFSQSNGMDWKSMKYYFESSEEVRFTFDAGFNVDINCSDGLYNDTNSFSFDFSPKVYLKGDLGNNLSYHIDIFGNATYVPLLYLGTYDPTDGWTHSNSDSINSYTILSHLPYSYVKSWDGSIYLLSDVSASGLTGWASDEIGVGFGSLSEISASFLQDKIFIRAGRIYREWAAMDEGSSLLLNASARPFMAFESELNPLSWLNFSFMTGILEFPNASYITNESSYTEAARYQNAYSIDMVGLNFKYFEADFGTSCIWPKRLEIGYAFPLFNKVFYQNNIGDYDNLNIFANVKAKLPGIGYVWFSGFLDELGNLKAPFNGEIFRLDRHMFALQGGAKILIPWIPFTSISLRYTKVEPYCYTHQQLNNTPWYSQYISESYSNNGYCLGYYLPPNSDELRLSFDSQINSSLTLNLAYQFIRHGADYGSRAVDGSSLYSELDPSIRDSIYKYFLCDGAYQWFNIISTTDTINLSKVGIPITIYTTVGFVYTWFTDTDSELGSEGVYHVINTSEYPTRYGIVGTVGIRVFY